MEQPQKPNSRRTLKFKLALALSFTVVTIVGCELLLRVFGFAPLYQYGEWKLRLDSEVLFRIVPSSGPEINSYGYRDHEFGPKAPKKFRVLFIGDSFVMGHNVKFNQTLPKVLERRLGDSFEVFNMGIYGYGPDQELVRFQKEGNGLAPDLVILGSFPANDFGDLYKNQLFTLNDKNVLQRNADNPVARALKTPSTLMLARSAFTGKFLEQSVEDDLADRLFFDVPFPLQQQSPATFHLSLELMLATIGQFKRETEKLPCKMCVLIIPSFESIKDPMWFQQHKIPFNSKFFNESAVKEICESLKLPALDLSPSFEKDAAEPIYDQEEHHLSAEGVEKAIDLLLPFLKEQQMIPAKAK